MATQMLPFSPDVPNKTRVKPTPQLDFSEKEMVERLLYRDAHLLIFNKPAGIAVHIGANAPVSIEQFFGHLQFGLPKPPVLAHRLDRETSGCLVLGRHRQATVKLGELFQHNKVQKTYHALVVGTPETPEGIINRPILKSGQGSRWRITLDDAGQPAVTEYRVLAKGEGASLLELKPHTGRTHQLRVHCAYGLGCAIIGDPFYGAKEGVFSNREANLMLHASEVQIPYDTKKAVIHAVALLPEHFIAMAEYAAVNITPLQQPSAPHTA